MKRKKDNSGKMAVAEIINGKQERHAIIARGLAIADPSARYSFHIQEVASIRKEGYKENQSSNPNDTVDYTRHDKIACHFLGAAGASKVMGTDEQFHFINYLEDRVGYEIDNAIGAALRGMDERYHRGTASVDFVERETKEFLSVLLSEATQLNLRKEFLEVMSKYKSAGGLFSGSMKGRAITALLRISDSI